MHGQSYIYIMTNFRNTTLYIGVTNNLIRRVYEHKNKLIPGFTTKYGVDKLGYYEVYENIEEAIKREKALKGSSRQRKVKLILTNNPDWKDLYDELL